MTKTPGRVGVALGAGSVKGFAHIGVLQVLDENRVPVDMIAGSSIGAIVGSIYAAGSDMHMLEKFVSSLAGKDFLDLPRPHRGGFLSGDRLKELTRIFTHDKSFGETNIPFFCTAVDLERGELVLLREGKLYEAVRASLSIPGVFAPVRLNGRLLVDGGVLDCVPCAPLREAGAEVVIGVDVGLRGEFEAMDPPTWLNVMERSTSIMQREITALRTQDADILICPRVNYMKWFDTQHTRAAIAEGRRRAQEAMPRIRALLEERGIPLRA